jgi:branched-chain amino acid transport system permease protein
MAALVRNRLLPTVLIAAAILLPFLVSTYYVQFASKLMIMGLLAMALNLVVGFGGLVSLCHAAFFGLAGYILALAAPQYEAASLWLSLPLAIAGAALAALAIGALSLRTRGIYFIMVTLAFGEMLFYLFHDTKIAGGSDGTFIYLKPEAAIAGRLLIDLDKTRTFYWVVLGFTLASIILLQTIVRSPFGHALTAARDNERRARSLGFPIYRLRLTAFVISGALAGLSGVLLANATGFVGPAYLEWVRSGELIVMVVLGGMGTVIGPVLGAAGLILLEEFIPILLDHLGAGWGEHWQIVLGPLLLLVVLFARQGLYGVWRGLWSQAAALRADGRQATRSPAAVPGDGW